MMESIEILFCQKETSLLEIYEIFNNAASKGLPVGIAFVVDSSGKLLGTVTGGDIRKGIVKNKSLDLLAKDIMEINPICFPMDYSLGSVIEELPKELALRNRKSKKYLSKIVFLDKLERPVKVIDYYQIWEQKVATHRHIVIVGLGYVGLTLAATLAEAGFKISGVESDPQKVGLLKEGNSYIYELGLNELLREQVNKNLAIASEIPEDGDVFIISVGTPVDKKTKKPDLNFIYQACKAVGVKLQRGGLVVLRSTIPVGTSREIVAVELEKYSGLKCGIDFHLSFAPERTAEGRALKELRTLPQIIGGYNEDSLEATVAIFRDLTNTIIRVPSLEAAEMAKLINNTFRDYIFAFSNQMAQIAYTYNLDVEQVINAANEGYPRDYVPLPSPGVGGPCLTKDSYIFASLSENCNFDPGFLLNSRVMNESMHEHVVLQVLDALKLVGKDPKKSSLVVCGLAFKGEPETGDIRDSSALVIAKLLTQKVGSLKTFDPVADEKEITSEGFELCLIPEGFDKADCVLFLNNHKYFEKIDVFNMVRRMSEQPIIYDAWRLFHGDDILRTRPSVYVSLSMIRSSLEARK